MGLGNVEVRLHELLASCRCGGQGLVDTARNHGVLGHLSRSGVGEYAGAGREGVQRALAHRMDMVSHLGGVIRRLHGGEIQMLTFKGPALSQLLYGEPFERDYGDLDLLVAPRDLDAARRCLYKEGFGPGYPSFSSPGRQAAMIPFCKAQTLHSLRGGCRVDLHWRLWSQWIAHDVPFETLWARRQELHIAGAGSAETFSNEDQILFLALHGCQHGWTKLKQLLDLALALDRLEYVATRLYASAGVRRPLVDLSLSLAVDLLGARAPQGHRAFFPDSEAAREFLLRSMARNREPRLAQLAPRFWEPRSGVVSCRALRAVLTPAVDDIASLELPVWAVGGYVVVRAWRLLRKALARSLPRARIRSAEGPASSAWKGRSARRAS